MILIYNLFLYPNLICLMFKFNVGNDDTEVKLKDATIWLVLGSRLIKIM